MLLLFDITDRKSFEACVDFINDIRENSDSTCKVYLVGNKIDLVDQRTVSKEEANLFANKLNLVYVETSAVKDNGVKEVFQSLIKGIYYILLFI